MCVRSTVPWNQLTYSNRASHNTGPTPSVLLGNPQQISQCRCNSVGTHSVAPWHMLVSPFCIPARAISDPHGSCLWTLHSAPLHSTGQAARHQLHLTLRSASSSSGTKQVPSSWSFFCWSDQARWDLGLAAGKELGNYFVVFMDRDRDCIYYTVHI